MLIVTGAAGFIGSCLIAKLNSLDIQQVLAVDDFGDQSKIANLNDKRIAGLIHRDQFLKWLDDNHATVHYIFHLGARTDTTEKDSRVFDRLNLDYSKSLWNLCSNHKIPLLYASSAATYGSGAMGYEDSHELIADLQPLNAYGDSKNSFDHWAIRQGQQPPHWVGLKFFNVYGPNEYHKGRMASVVFQAYHQIKETGQMKLFRSHRPDIADGDQSRDFIYVKDILDICFFCLESRPHNGIYNAGTGHARSFLDLVKATFAAMKIDPDIEFIDTPEDIRDTYQYFTQAPMRKLISQGYDRPMTSLESGVSDYVENYLLPGLYL